MNVVTNAVIAVSEAIEQLEAQRDYGDIKSDGLEALTILNVCYELLARTSIVEKEINEPNPELANPEIENPSKRFPHTTDDTIEEFLFRIASGKGDISLRKFLDSMLRNGKYSPNKLTQVKIAKAVGIRQATISDYLNNKIAMTSDNIEKIVNCLQNNS